ncbi:hypothetical protein [uncultured Bacteroides sp.]|uniref:hypothetical protein n=1 Tax=uncultured Bacteroides sp. TaxID=162156 RepID=UPI002612A207|nr:hypothetical protein [uncultured Bacteroides sp.]
MRKTRICENARINTGSSICKIDWGKIRGCILMESGQKLTEFTREALEQLCHADRPMRIYPIVGFVEYAKNGGEPQVSAVGYGPSLYNGLNTQTDTFTLPKFDETLNANLMKGASQEWDVYFFDEKRIYGYNDGTDILAGMRMATVYPTVTPFSTSSSKSTMTVSFCHADIEDTLMHIDFVDMSFNLSKVLKGLTEVVLEKKGETTEYQIVEKIGGYDLTSLYGDVIAKNATTVLLGATSATYENGALTIVAAGDVSLAAPSVLYENDIKYIEGVTV